MFEVKGDATVGRILTYLVKKVRKISRLIKISSAKELG